MSLDCRFSAQRQELVARLRFEHAASLQQEVMATVGTRDQTSKQSQAAISDDEVRQQQHTNQLETTSQPNLASGTHLHKDGYHQRASPYKPERNMSQTSTANQAPWRRSLVQTSPCQLRIVAPDDATIEYTYAMGCQIYEKGEPRQLWFQDNSNRWYLDTRM